VVLRDPFRGSRPDGAAARGTCRRTVIWYSSHETGADGKPITAISRADLVCPSTFH
jgi:hypothetical protein